MKKTLLLATFASLSLSQAKAQQIPDLLFPNRAGHKHTKVTQNLLRLQSTGNIAQKPTGLKQRVIAQALNTPFFSDSTRFTYIGTNGSVYDFNNPDYNYADNFTYEYAPMFIAPFQASSSRIIADSIIKYDGNDLAKWSKAFYRADKKIDSVWNYFFDGTMFTNSRAINVYNAQGYLTTTYGIQQNPPPVWDTFSYQRFYYNSTFTRMDRDSSWFGISAAPSLRQSDVYYYGASGKLDSFVTWDLQGAAPFRSQSYVMTYTSTGKLQTVKNYDLESGTPSLIGLDSIGYTNGVDYYTYHESNQYENDTLYDGTREIKFVGAGGLVDSVQGYGREGESSPWTFQGSFKYTYNSYSNPEKLTATLVGLPGSLDVYKFYYETYDDGLSIKPVTASKDFSIYPNPFHNTLAIDWKGKQPGAVSLRLVNILGQEVYSQSLKLSNGKNTLNLPALSTGDYILFITDAEGKSWSSKVVKQ